MDLLAQSGNMGQEDVQQDAQMGPFNTEDVGLGERPTCRICRGEETPEEPLFYPCKCNGSIRFVHQECLMEWLSRSQKRHCELCKTPFRFTKLYDPHMPSSVPTPVFIRQAFVQAGRAISRILRYFLVTFVWLCWVPWTMRTMWRFLFWLGDGAWVDHRESLIFPGITVNSAYGSQFTNASHAATGLVNSTTNGQSDSNGTTSPLESFVRTLRGFLFPMAVNPTLTSTQHLNDPQTTYQPLMLRLVRQLLRGSLVMSKAPQAVDSAMVGTIDPARFRRNTMLSEVKYLQTFSRWPALNSTVIDILEGQLITLFVMVLIILVFLIREWVVQQQPNLAALRALDNPQAVGDNRADDERAAQDPILEPAVRADERIDNLNPLDASEEQQSGERARLDVTAHLTSDGQDSTEDDFSRQYGPARQSALRSQRPPMPRDALDRAGELQRILEEEREKFEGDKWPGMQTFMDYWHRGNCKPEKVLDLIRQDEKGEELAWIVRAMERLVNEGVLNSEIEDNVNTNAYDEDSNLTHHEGSGSGDESWQDLSKDSAEGIDAVRSTHELQAQPDAVSSSWLQDQNLSWPPTEEPADVEILEAGPRNITDEVQHEEARQASANGPSDVEAETEAAAEVEHVPADSEPETQANANRTFWDSLANLLWGDVNLPPAEQQQVANQLGPMLQPDVDHGAPLQQQPIDPRGPPGLPANQFGVADPNAAAGAFPMQDAEVLRAAQEAGVQPEDIQAIEDADDLDGLVELIGLQGPLVALIQHGMVCGAIVTLVVFFGIWVPYVVGKVVLVLISNPLTLLVKLPLRWTSLVINLFIDISISAAGYGFFYLDWLIRLLVSPIGWILPFFARLQQNTDIPDTALSFASRSLERLGKNFVGEVSPHDNDIPIFSVIAHESLIRLQDGMSRITVSSYNSLERTLETPRSLTVIGGNLIALAKDVPGHVVTGLQWAAVQLECLTAMLYTVSHTNPFKLRLEFPERTEPFNVELVEWSTHDRVLAIALGYLAFYMVGAMYVKMKQATRGTHAVRDEALEILSQAGGVLKVILIITIEMIAFPLYCGLLLDGAMLPLFEGSSLLTRLTFAVENPLTSGFLHWFVGTCYMFHFALFVAMCRKSMRSGVLYFIRDPDDPTFHPVRDVLERNLIGQLRKILFSALVYGALVIICLGAVVWGVAATPTTVFPIRWSSLDPSTELPIDLVVLNFLVPIAVKVLDPSQGLEAIYKWWFRHCAKALRLSDFLFGEPNGDQEGRWISQAPHPENDAVDNRGQNADGSNASNDGGEATEMRATLAEAVELLDKVSENRVADNRDAMLSKQHNGMSPQRRLALDGTFVRAPATDQVRIPRNQHTFMPVDEMNNRIDGLAEPADGSLHAKSNKQFQIVWLPPNFRLRIGLFIFLLWGFAAVTGLGVTVVPLLCGRYVFDTYLPASAPVNDVHAFCFGAYVFGGPIFLILRYHTTVTHAYLQVHKWAIANATGWSVIHVTRKMSLLALHGLRLIYFYSCFGFIIPILMSTVLEFYLFIPLASHIGARFDLQTRRATVSLIQNWTVGILYLRIVGRFIHNNQESRPARALFALVAPTNKGAHWWDPDVLLATRAFFLPSLALIGAALFVPFAVAAAINTVYLRDAAPGTQILVYRYSYPAVAISVVVALLVSSAFSAYRSWRARIRDEVYLIGERLHNFGQGKNIATSYGNTSL